MGPVVAAMSVYVVEIHPSHRPLILGGLRRLHGWRPANEGRACLCERCVRRRRYRHAHKVRRR